MQKIVPHLWFDSRAEDAARTYVSLFNNSKIGVITYYDEVASKVAGQPAGSVMTVSFELDGQQFVALNGGPMFKLNEAFSMLVRCESEAELDELWARLSADGEIQMCGWLKDRFGLSWQIVPTELEQMIQNPDREKRERVLKAMMEMKKLDLPGLKRAFEGA